MNAFLQQTISDLRGGRQSWRVLTTLCVPSFAVSVATYILQNAR
jgi:hypothetical protein